MKKLFLPIFLCTILASCGSKEELPAGVRGESFQLADDKQASMIEALKKSNIDFAVDDRGFINYMAADISKVRKLKRKVVYGSRISSYDSLSEGFSSSARKDVFVDVLTSKGVWHDVSTFKGTINVTYLLQDVEKVDEAYQEAFFVYYRQRNN